MGQVRRGPRAAKLDFFEPIDDLMEIEDKVCTIGNEQSVRAIKTFAHDRVGACSTMKRMAHTLRLKCVKLRKERRNVNDNAVPYEPGALWVDEPWGRISI